jgi:transcription elongation factor Elf1
MVFAGKKTSILKSNISKEVICPNCKAENATQVAVLGTYKHLLHIPFFSGGKHGTSICKNCNHTFELKNMPNSIKLAYYELKETTKTPMWHYSGIIAIKLLVIIKIFSRYF